MKKVKYICNECKAPCKIKVTFTAKPKPPRLCPFTNSGANWEKVEEKKQCK